MNELNEPQELLKDHQDHQDHGRYVIQEMERLDKQIQSGLLIELKSIKRHFIIGISLALTALALSVTLIIHTEFLSFFFWVNFICILVNLKTITVSVKSYRENSKDIETIYKREKKVDV